MSSQPDQYPENQSNEAPQINTEGGSIVQGNLSINDGDFVGRDKNIYIGSILIPRWLLSVLATTVIIVTLTILFILNRSNETATQTRAISTKVFEPPTSTPPLIPAHTPTPAVMGDVFGFAIAPLQAINLNGEVVQPDFASSISGNIANYMREQTGELVDLIGQSVDVWGPDLVRQLATDKNVSMMANKLNADVVVYGLLTQIDDQRWSLQPSFFLSEDAVQRAVNLGGEYPLGTKIEYRTDNNSSLRDINLALRTRLKSLSQIAFGVSALSILLANVTDEHVVR